MFGCGRGYAAPQAVSPAAVSPVMSFGVKACWYLLPFFILFAILGLTLPGGFIWILLLILLIILICVAFR